jgi:hypothetical protein
VEEEAVVEAPAAVRIHVPGEDFGRDEEEADEPAAERPVRDSGPVEGVPGEPGGSPVRDESAADGEEQAPAKRKTRRGSRGGRNRKRKTAGAAVTNGTEGEEVPVEEAPEPEPNGDTGYVPMSEWIDDFESARG